VLTKTPSGVVTVIASAATQVRVETAANGSGAVVTAQNLTSGSTLTVFSITRDAAGNFVENVAADSWALINKTGGVVDGDLVVAGDSRSATLTGTLVGTAQIEATEGVLAKTPSGIVTVVVGAASQVRVETAANGSGAVVGAQNLTSGSTLTVFSITRDAAGNFIANVAADSWALINKTGGVVDGDLVPAGDSRSATLTGNLVGTARIEATEGVLAKTPSGVITVIAGAATGVRVETAANGSGAVVGAQNLASGSALTVFSITRDAAGNFVENVAADSWALINKTGGVVDGDLVVAGDSRSATLTGAIVGTAQIEATEGVLAKTPSGIVTVVAGAASQVRVETAANGSGAVVGAQNLTSGSTLTVFSVTRDAAGNFVANVAADSWALINKTGGVVDGDLVVAGDSRSATLTGTLVGTAQIEATEGVLAKTPSGVVTVVVGAASQVRVETAANGSGAVVGAQNLTSGSTLTVFSVTRDAAGNFIENVAADSWALINKTGGVVDGDLVAAGDNKSATLTGTLVGTAQIEATEGVLAKTPSGIITVIAGAATGVRVETAANGSGAVVGAQNLTSGSTLTVFAVTRDAAGNFVENVAADSWALINKTGGVVDADLVAAGDNKSATLTGTLVGTAQIEATEGVLAKTPSGVITVIAGAATGVRVETAANGSGAVVGAQNLTSGSTLTVFAVTRDAAGNFIENVAADSWALISKTGGVVDADLVAAGDSKSATLTGALVGTAQIEATEGVLAKTASGVITVIPGAATQVRVETLADGSGVVVPLQNVPSATSITVFSITRDAAGNFIENVASDSWTLVAITGGVLQADLAPAGDLKSAVFTGGAAGSAQIEATSALLTKVASGVITVP
jgi:hypothetical protein